MWSSKSNPFLVPWQTTSPMVGEPKLQGGLVPWQVWAIQPEGLTISAKYTCQCNAWVLFGILCFFESFYKIIFFGKFVPVYPYLIMNIIVHQHAPRVIQSVHRFQQTRCIMHTCGRVSSTGRGQSRLGFVGANRGHSIKRQHVYCQPKPKQN